MKFTNKMIITDLDATFGSPITGPAPGNIEAVKYFTDNGGVFTVASGRVPSAMSMWQEVKTIVNAPTILCNGAFCYDFSDCSLTDQMVLDKEKAIEIVRTVLSDYHEISMRCCLGAVENRLVGDEILEDFENWTRVSFDGEKEVLDKLRAYLEPIYGDCFAFMKACDTILEFQASTATKGQAIDRLKSRLKAEGRITDAVTVYAVGDFENDLDLLSRADIACCPQNAIDSVKAACQIHLCHYTKGAIADLVGRIENSYVKS